MLFNILDLVFVVRLWGWFGVGVGEEFGFTGVCLEVGVVVCGLFVSRFERNRKRSLVILNCIFMFVFSFVIRRFRM